MKLVDTLERRRVNIVCIQETIWVREKSKKVGNSEYKPWFTRKERNKNGEEQERRGHDHRQDIERCRNIYKKSRR